MKSRQAVVAVESTAIACSLTGPCAQSPAATGAGTAAHSELAKAALAKCNITQQMADCSLRLQGWRQYCIGTCSTYKQVVVL